MIHVVIPVYNAEKYLQDAVDSVLNQPCKDIDIVLVDDGSPDGSGALCDALAAQNSRITVIHQKNAGVSAARNAGIEAVLETAEDTDYIAFLDADDIWVPGILSEAALDDNDHADIISFGTITCTEDVRRYSYPCSYEPHTSRWKFLYLVTGWSFWSQFIPGTAVAQLEYPVRSRSQVQ